MPPPLENDELVAPPCPGCNQQGILVRSITVQNLLQPDLKEQVHETSTYYLCTDSFCNISYYENGAKKYFAVKDVKVPIWYKNGAEPIMACYCNKITRDEVVQMVKTYGLTDMNKIIIRLRGKVKNTCVAKNPTGQCCNDFFNEIIQEALTDSED